MIIYKVWYHLVSFIKVMWFKILWQGKFCVGENLQFRKGFTLLIMSEGRVKIGDDVFFNNYCSVCSMNNVSIGTGTIFGENVKIYDHNHIYTDTVLPIKKQGYTSAPIYIGVHCWIGSNVTILKGVKIGDNCVIGAGCVIYKDVPSNTRLVNKQDLLSL